METEVFTINIDQLNMNKIRDVANAISEGHIVAFPTDTIYGMGCDVFNEEAVEALYEIKGRPKNKPINVLISSVDQVYDIAKNIKPLFFNLAEKFWPGALTIIVEKNTLVSDVVTSGLSNVGVRFPNNKVVQELINITHTPLATTSANLSEEPSATKAKDVLKYFSGKIPYIIDGGTAEIGQSSTIVDIASKPPKVIRHGAIEYAELKPHIRGLRKN
jgi:L-threonylcarbamoyladenylate synthase